MRNPLTSMDLFFLMKELQGLRNGFIEKTWSIEKNYYVFKVRSNKSFFLSFLAPGLLWISNLKKDSVVNTSLNQLLRKRISRKRILDVRQIGSERIIELILEDYSLFIELIPPGNIVLVRDGLIEGAMIYKSWKDRSIKPKAMYNYPRSIDYLHMDRDDLKKELLRLFNEKKDWAKALAVLGLGRFYAEEVVFRSNIDRSVESSIDKIIDTFLALKSEEVKGYLYDQGLFPIRMLSLGKEVRIYDSFSLGIDEEISKGLSIDNPELNVLMNKLGAINSSIKQQEELIKKNLEKSEEYRLMGESIYEHYLQIKVLLDDYNKGVSIDVLKDKYKFFKGLNKDKLLIEFD